MEFTLFGRSLWTVLPDEMLDEWIELGSDVSEMAYDLNKLKNFLKEEDCRHAHFTNLMLSVVDKL